MTIQTGNAPRPVRIAAVQPPISDAGMSLTHLDRTVATSRSLAEQALGELRADLVVLPELLNVFGLGIEEALKVAGEAEHFLTTFQELGRDHAAHVVVPVLERRDGEVFNCSVVLGPGGERVGHYDKTHLALAEREWFGITPGDTYPLFEANWGRFGVMTCYDAYFPEVPRIYAGLGADVVAYPSWQSGPSELWFDVQMRCRALDNFLVVVRSSFGYDPHVAWKPGLFFGRSAIVDRDGTIVSDAGHYVGTAFAELDLDRQMRMDILDEGGNVQDLRELVFAQRRPDTYGLLTEPWRDPIDAHALFAQGEVKRS